MSDARDHVSTPEPTEFNFFILLSSPQEINDAWLEKKAFAMEEALIADCAGVILGPAVAANFDENGWEIDLTVEAMSRPEAEEKFAQAMEVVERVGEIRLVQEETELRKTFHSDRSSDAHESVLVG